MKTGRMYCIYIFILDRVGNKLKNTGDFLDGILILNKSLDT